jgi:DNA replication protein DnaC
VEKVIEKFVPGRYRIEPRLKDIKPSKFVTLDVKLQTEIIKALNKNPLGGYFFCGATSTGKTYLMWALYKEAVYAGRNALYMTCSEMIRKMKLDEFNPNCLEGFSVSDFEKNNSQSPAHLFIDECGKLGDTEYSFSKFFEVIDFCYMNPDIVRLSLATNYNLELFRESYGEALTRRLEEICDVVGER